MRPANTSTICTELLPRPEKITRLRLASIRKVIYAALDAGERYFLDFAHRRRFAFVGVSDGAERASAPAPTKERIK